MAKNKSTVYLGFEDEEINEKNRSLLNFCVNKIGGYPDWCGTEIRIPNCPICSLNRPLIVQIYAPLDNSQFHRVLYIFGCLNPQCSFQSRSWLCIRAQTLDTNNENLNLPKQLVQKTKSKVNGPTLWCSEADDWDGNDDIINNIVEKNGNVISFNKVDNSQQCDGDDDESNSNDDESNSIDDERNSLLTGLDNLNIHNLDVIDDKTNANLPIQGAQGGAANGKLFNSPSQQFYAEIEGEESEMVLVESPIKPNSNLIELMKHSNGFPKIKLSSLCLKSFFLHVEEEHENSIKSNNYYGLLDHVRELIQEYQRDEIEKVDRIDFNSGGEQENYEKSVPAHGDIIFHNFTSILQNNPGQILRYSRDAYPVLISPLLEPIPKCQYCGGETICELQILPTLIPKLKLENLQSAPIEFGNILIFTCMKSCWDTPDKMRFENVITQKEV